MEKFGQRGIEQAGAVCGASPLKVLLEITLPLIMPGVISGSVMDLYDVFLVHSVVPLIAGGDYRPIAVQIYTETSVFNNWENGSALAVIMSVVQIVFLVFYMKFSRKRWLK